MTATVDLKQKKILVTGATGQVALPIIEALAKQSDVWAMARFKNPADVETVEKMGATVFKADLLADDFSGLPEDFDYVLNYAVAKSGKFDLDLEANAEGAGKLMVHCKACKAFVHFSSTSVYQYEGHEPRLETSPYGDNHRNLLPTYSISKIAAESVVKFVAHQYKIPTIIARLSVPYGDNGGWPYFHLLMAQQGMEIDVHPERPNYYNLLHAEDHVEKIPALIAAATEEVEVVNFGGSERVSIEEWCEYIEELTGIVPKLRDNPKAFGSLSINTDKMHALLGETKIHWRDGLKRMFENVCPELLKEKEMQP